MYNNNSISWALGLTALLILSAGSVAANAQQAHISERALTWTENNDDLQWDPCPPFLPVGCAIAVLHGDPARANVDVFFKLPGGSEFANHWHTSAERMVLVKGELHVTYEGQDEVVLTPGTYAYGPAKLKHHGSCVSVEDCVLFIAFEESLDAVPVED
jgi:mannose-6-phosphate isomerase-like protein (cupin superfamily)